MKDLRRILIGAALIVVQAIAIGFAANAINPHGLPLIRKPLRETHRMASKQEVMPTKPAPVAAVGEKKAETKPTPSVDIKSEAQKSAEQPETPVVASKEKAVPPQVKPAKPTIAANSTEVKPKVKPKAKKIMALFTNLADSKMLWDKKAAIFMDARHKEDYDAEHIEGALSLYLDELDKQYDGALGAISKDKTLVTYCSDPQCETAIKLADALVAKGHTHVLILLEGLPGWRDAGYPTTKGGDKQ